MVEVVDVDVVDTVGRVMRGKVRPVNCGTVAGTVVAWVGGVVIGGVVTGCVVGVTRVVDV